MHLNEAMRHVTLNTRPLAPLRHWSGTGSGTGSGLSGTAWQMAAQASKQGGNRTALTITGHAALTISGPAALTLTGHAALLIGPGVVSQAISAVAKVRQPRCGGQAGTAVKQARQSSRLETKDLRLKTKD